MSFVKWAALFCLSALLIVAGCHKQGAGELTDKDRQAFDSASAELKQTWQAALEAVKTNDYVGAQTLLYGMLNQNLSPDQKEAVTKESTSINNRLYEGVEKGDPVAVKAFEDMKRNPPGRQAH